jgi:FkbM family methyltransferase
MRGIFQPLAEGLFKAGFRKPVAALVSAYYGRRTDGRQHFAIGREGHWLNEYAPWTIASNRVHTAAYPAYREWVLDNWCWQYKPQAGDTVIDVGAGVGEEAVVFSDLVGPSGRVVSIEAHPATFGCLQETVRLSALNNVLPLALAIGDRDGLTTIAEADNYLASSIMHSEGLGTHVKLRSLDSLLDELGLEKVTLLKMNIEGAEGAAADGMSRLAKRVKHAVISCHDFISDRGGPPQFRTFDHVCRRLKELGFQLTMRPDDPRPWTRYYIYALNPELPG